MLQELERRLKEMGEEKLAEEVAAVHKKLNQKGVDDLPFPELVGKRKSRERVATTSEVPAVLFASREQPVILPKFSTAQKTALETVGRIIYPVEAKSIRQLAAESAEYKEFFGYVDLSNYMLDIVPKATEVAIDPNNLVLKESAERSFYKQLKMLLKEIDGGQGVAVGMACASVYCQLDIAHQQQAGNKLFADFFCRTPDGKNYSTIVGRLPENPQLYVQKSRRRLCRKDIVVVPVAVPIQL